MAQFTYDHVHLRSPDPEATAAFYEPMFAAESDPHDPVGQATHRSQLGGANAFIAAVDARPRSIRRRGRPIGGSSISVCASPTSMLRRRVQGQGCRVHDGADGHSPGGAHRLLARTKGVSIELLERKRA